MANEFDGATRSRIAEAVHGAVCEVNGGDGFGRCADYAVAGALVLNLLTDRRYSPQVGGVDILCQPPSRYFHICGDDNGLARGEYHCWVACAAGPAPGMPGRSLASEWIDFSARHYRRMAETLVNIDKVVHQDAESTVLALDRGPRREWTAPEPPPYVWHEGSVPPDWVLFYVDEASSRGLMKQIEGEGRDHFLDVARAAVDRLRPLLAARKAALARRLGSKGRTS